MEAAASRCRSDTSVDDRVAKRNRDRVRPSVRLELGEDVPDVALDRLLADEEPCRDVCIRHPVREELQDLALPPREHLVARVAEERGHQCRIDEALASDDLVDRLQQRLVRRLLEDVALGARLKAAPEQAPLAVGGENQHRRLGNLLAEDLRRLEAVHARHPDVHDHNVGFAPLGQRDRGGAVGGLADDADMRRTLERKPQAFADDLVVVHDQARDLVASLPVFRQGLSDCMREIGGWSDREGELLGDHRRLGLQAHAAAVADAVLRCQRVDPLAQRLRLRLAPDVLVERRDRERDRDVRPARGLDEHVDVADDHRPARDDAERVVGLGERLEAAPRQLVVALRRLVRVRRRADRHDLVLPGCARQLAPQNLDDVDLDPDRAAVAIVEGPVGPALEGPDVAEGAAVDAPHIGVERPVEHHPLDPVEGALAGLLSILGSHGAKYTNTCSSMSTQAGATLSRDLGRRSSKSHPGGGRNVTLFLELLGVAALILLNAFFVAAEYALVTARRTKIQELADEGSRRARVVQRIVSDPPHFIAAMQLGVTLASLGIGALGEQALAHALDPYLATVLAVAIGFLIITYLHVVIGELVPKGAALRYSERIALGVSTPVRAFFFVFHPLIWFLEWSSEVTMRALGFEPPGGEGEALSEAELRMLLGRATEHGEIEREEQEMLYKVFDFADKEVADVMVPRPEVVALSIDLPPEECLAAVIESPFTRYPVYRETLDDIIGVLHVRDLFSALNDQGFANVRIEELLREAYIVPETKDLASLLADFRRQSFHMAVVVDEYGTMAGIVTLEDLLEEIVGEIEDEFDLPDESIEQVDERTIRIGGTFPIDDFNEKFGTKLQLENFQTVAGFVFGLLGRAADAGDEVDYDGLHFRVLEVEGSRIERLEVRFIPLPPRERDESQEAAA